MLSPRSKVSFERTTGKCSSNNKSAPESFRPGHSLKSSGCHNLHTLPNSEHMSQLQQAFSRHAAVFLSVGLL